jgi:hypothetical protein
MTRRRFLTRNTPGQNAATVSRDRRPSGGGARLAPRCAMHVEYMPACAGRSGLCLCAAIRSSRVRNTRDEFIHHGMLFIER